MYKQIVVMVVACLAAAAVGREYPAGLNPALCPNYPFCNNELIALHTPVPYTAPGFPANVNPAGCPNYPFCNPGQLVPYPAW